MIVHPIQNWMTRIGWVLFVFVLYSDKCTKLIQNWMIIAYHIQIWMITDGQNFLELDRKLSSEVAWDTCTEIFRKNVKVIHVTPSPKNHNKLHVCSKNSCCQCWMAQGVFSAGILVVTDLVVVSFIHPLRFLFPHTYGRLGKNKNGFGWHGGGKSGSQPTKGATMRSLRYSSPHPKLDDNLRHPNVYD